MIVGPLIVKFFKERPLFVILGTLIGVPAVFGILHAVAGEIELQVPGEARYLIFGLLLVFLMRFRPEGLVPLVRHGKAPSEEELEQLRAQPSELFSLGADK
jgi:ABC-type branched-subunit amino acid transport system permease subunit